MAPRIIELRQRKHDLQVEAGKLDLSSEDGTKRLEEIYAAMNPLDSDLLAEEKRLEIIRTMATSEPAAYAPARVTDLSAEKPFASLSEQLLAIRAAARPGGPVDPRLYGPQIGAAPLGNNVGQGSDGGWLLQTDFRAGIWERSYQMGQLISRCTTFPIGDNADSVVINGMDETSRAAGSRWGGVRGYWVAEAATLTASQPHFSRVELRPKKLAVLVYATSEMLRNPTTLESVIRRVAPLEITFMTEAAIYSGDGVGKPLGATVAPCAISVTKEVGQGAATIVAENIMSMWNRMWAGSRANAVWLINQDCEAQLDMLSMPIGVGGVPMYMPAGGLSEAPYGRLKGRPVIPVEYCATLGSVGDIALVDFSQYALSDRGTVRADSSIHVQFLTDETAFRFIYEVDGSPLWANALTPVNSTATLSPIITLAVRA